VLSIEGRFAQPFTFIVDQIVRRLSPDDSVHQLFTLGMRRVLETINLSPQPFDNRVSRATHLGQRRWQIGAAAVLLKKGRGEIKLTHGRARASVSYSDAACIGSRETDHALLPNRAFSRRVATAHWVVGVASAVMNWAENDVRVAIART